MQFNLLFFNSFLSTGQKNTKMHIPMMPLINLFPVLSHTPVSVKLESISAFKINVLESMGNSIIISHSVGNKTTETGTELSVIFFYSQEHSKSLFLCPNVRAA